MKIIKKSVAVNYQKVLGCGANIMKYDSGKYNWSGSQNHYIGRDIEVGSNIIALYVERRSDVNGAYAQIMCVVSGR